MNSTIEEEPSKANLTEIKDTSRDYLMDNLRAVFIILVVWGHVLTSMKDSSDMIKGIYIFIYFFHMPAMVFISGYFSKNLEKIRNNAFVTLLIPYLILNVCNYLFKMLILHEDYFGFRFFHPLWGLWYLLALFLWKFFLKDLVRIRFLLPFSFIFALLSGFSREFSEYLALGRTICFLPFFLLGYYCTKDHINTIRKIPKWISIGIIFMSASLAAFLSTKEFFPLNTLYLRNAYPQEAEITGMGMRALLYLVAIVMIIAFINLMSDKKCFISSIGTKTLTVYILHLFTIPLLEKAEILNNRPMIYIIYSIVIAVVIVFIYSRPIVKKGYDLVMDRLTSIMLKNKQ